MGLGKMLVVGAVAGGAVFGASHWDKIKCVGEFSDGGFGAVSDCFGWSGGGAEGEFNLPTKQREFAPSTVRVQVLGTVVMELAHGSAIVDIEHNLLGQFGGGTPGLTDSTLKLNKDDNVIFSVVYNPCFGMKTEKDGQPSAPAANKSEYDPPVSNIGYKITPLDGGKVSVEVNPGPMQVCFPRVPNTYDKQGLRNLTAWYTENGGIITTNTDDRSTQIVEQLAMASFNSLTIAVANAQACPTEALKNGGMTDESIKNAVGDAALGGILRDLKGSDDEAAADAVQEAFDEGRYKVVLSPDSERQPAAEATLNKMIQDLRGKDLIKYMKEEWDYKDIPDNFTAVIQTIRAPQIVSCGTGKINGGS